MTYIHIIRKKTNLQFWICFSKSFITVIWSDALARKRGERERQSRKTISLTCLLSFNLNPLLTSREGKIAFNQASYVISTH